MSNNLKIFKLTADCEFEAQDIDDALIRLSKHFRELTEKGCSQNRTVMIGGVIELKPCKVVE